MSRRYRHRLRKRYSKRKSFYEDLKALIGLIVLGNGEKRGFSKILLKGGYEIVVFV